MTHTLVYPLYMNHPTTDSYEHVNIEYLDVILNSYIYVHDTRVTSPKLAAKDSMALIALNKQLFCC